MCRELFNLAFILKWVLNWTTQNREAHYFVLLFIAWILNSANAQLFGITVWKNYVCCTTALPQLCSLWIRSYCDRLPHTKKKKNMLNMFKMCKYKKQTSKKQRAGVGEGGKDMKRRWRVKMRAVLSKTAALHHKNNKWRLSLLLRS